MSEAIDGAIDAGGDALGAAAGAGVGLVVAGPAGSVGGAVIGSVLSSLFKRIGDEVHDRYLSKGERERIGEVFTLAKLKITQRMDAGDAPRDDGFFEGDSHLRPAADEVLEGVLLVAQREYEELKLPYLANLYANIAFEKTITRPMADRLIKIAEQLTYRQLVILRVIGLLQIQPQEADARKTEAFGSVTGYSEVSVASDIYDLYRMSLVASSEALLDAAGINPSKLELCGYGAHLYNLMELNTMDLGEDADEVMRFLEA